MGTLLDAIHARQLADVPPAEREPLVVDTSDWESWDGTNATCPWELIGVNEWRHVRTGQVFTWGQPYVLPGEVE